MKVRGQVLINAPLGLLAVATSSRAAEAESNSPTPGAPPTFGATAAVGPEVTATTFAEAEKLMQVSMTPAERDMAASSWRVSLASSLERRTGPRKLALDPEISPASVWNPAFVANKKQTTQNRFVRSYTATVAISASDEDIAYAPVTLLSRWIENKTLSSVRLTEIYLDRIQRLDPKIRSVISVAREHALARAQKADVEIAAGKYRGPLHGIPYGVKDLLDSAGIATTWGAEPFKDRVPNKDATVVARLNEAGAVMIAKLSLGALALNDVWFGGQTMNPWLLEEGASGSSAGSGAATAAALVGFSIGSETGGSIVSPSMRCGVTGLRPTYGRVPRTGAMPLCWSLDKLGPMTRSVEDAMLVLDAIFGPDNMDVACVPTTLDFDANASIRGLKVGYFPNWTNGNGATDVDRAALEAVKILGMIPTSVSLPDWPYGSLNVILFAEAAAAFEEITLDSRVNQLMAQVPDAWPNLFRAARFLSAVDFVQSDRLRRKVAIEMARIMNEVDLLLVPSLRDEMLTISNFTGHPSLTLKIGTVQVFETRSDWAPNPKNPPIKFATPRSVPYGVTFIGRLFDEATIACAGLALEKHFDVAQQRPPGF